MGLADSFAGVRCPCEDESGQKAAWRKLCRIIRHLGSGIKTACAFTIAASGILLSRKELCPPQSRAQLRGLAAGNNFLIGAGSQESAADVTGRVNRVDRV
jgi:hypothetical protein